MQTIFRLLLIIPLLSGCVNLSHLKVHETYDEVLQADLRLFDLDLKAKSLWKHKRAHPMHLSFINSKRVQNTTHKLNFNLNLSRNTKLQDSVYFMLDSKIIPLPIESINYSPRKYHKTNSESQVIEPDEKSKNKNRETKIITEVMDTEWEYNYTYVSLLLPDSLVDELTKVKTFNLRIYVNNSAYTAHINGFSLTRINRVYNLSST